MFGESALANVTPTSFDRMSTCRFVGSGLSLMRIFFAVMSAAGASPTDTSSNAAAEMLPSLIFDMVSRPPRLVSLWRDPPRTSLRVSRQNPELGPRFDHAFGPVAPPSRRHGLRRPDGANPPGRIHEDEAGQRAGPLP